jgi:hypothetical protein
MLPIVQGWVATGDAGKVHISESVLQQLHARFDNEKSVGHQITFP